MTHNEAQTFAAEWAAAWNRRDIESVLAHYDENLVFTSPTAKAVTGAGVVHGKAALRAYWTTALARISHLHFTVERVLWDGAAQELAIIYLSETGERKRWVSENHIFGPDGLVIRAEVFHGVEV